MPGESELFYALIQRGIDTWNAVFFCGSCAVLRRSALDEVGGIAVETVTEDAHTALKLHRKGYGTAYLAIPQAAGLATESLSGHVGQRIRWARGMAQIFRLDNPFTGKGLTLWQRICYANAMVSSLGRCSQRMQHPCRLPGGLCDGITRRSPPPHDLPE